ncbi:MAG TPA: hydrogenase maturation protein [Solirubrobacteraceae bacterium]|jgi:putative two-component system hydrogenase maturation factor HypX/HoxX
MQILFLVSAHNSLSQRAWIALTELGHDVVIAVVDSASAMEAAVSVHAPDLIVCPFLKTLIPESIWGRHSCLIVHPGPRGDRGPSSLDWAIELDKPNWGVTVLQANGAVDAGEVWATGTFAMRNATKSSLYRHEVRRAAIDAVIDAIDRLALVGAAPSATAPVASVSLGPCLPLMTEDVRVIDWTSDRTERVLRKIRAGDGHPGVLDTIRGKNFHLFGVHPERTLHGRPGELLAQRNGAVCRATVDGAVWITHLKWQGSATERHFKLPAARALARAGIRLEVPEVGIAFDAQVPEGHTYRDIAYHEHAGVGYLRFEFYNGAMSTSQCQRLREAYAHARAQEHTNAIVLLGGDDYFSNGIHLNEIEAADDPAEESWRNLQAIDDLVKDILDTDSHLVISAIAGDAAAGGVPLALAADYVLAREDIVLNPYYQHMGGLYGSEYWTYLLPRRVGPATTARLTGAPFQAIGTNEAVRIGLLDAAFGEDVEDFRVRTARFAERVAHDGLYQARLKDKRLRRAQDERARPLDAYRHEELARCHQCFFGSDSGYHDARRRFVYKLTARDSAGEEPARLAI